MANQVVCVTGASGFIASWLVKLLLARGYTVNATVRNLSQSSNSLLLITCDHNKNNVVQSKFSNPGDPRKVSHLTALEGADERLRLFEADLMNEGSFDSVIHGCQGVFHTASPVYLSVSDPQVILLHLLRPILK